MTFARGKEAQARKAAKAKRPAPLVAKSLGLSAVDKLADWRSDAHLTLVRAQPCIVSRSLVGVVAHHPDEAFPHLVAGARKISDFLCLPMRYDLHDPATPGSVHKLNHVRWWAERHIDVYAWLRGFLRRHYPVGHPGAEAALAEILVIEQRKHMDGRVTVR